MPYIYKYIYTPLSMFISPFNNSNEVQLATAAAEPPQERDDNGKMIYANRIDPHAFSSRTSDVEAKKNTLEYETTI